MIKETEKIIENCSQDILDFVNNSLDRSYSLKVVGASLLVVAKAILGDEEAIQKYIEKGDRV